ncbi:MAG TPA: thioesterase family protein [Acidimicrobiia bacterium]|nr:thioesterase family protein [Acidimicrobiia bacterium]
MDDTVTASQFTLDTGVVADPDTPGRYVAHLSDQWNAPMLPQGGVVTSLALRAMAAELDHPEQRLRSVTTAFAAQVPAGPVQVDVSVLRRGRSLSQAVATVAATGAEAGHTSLAVFGADRPGFSFTDLTPPVVPPPEDCDSFRDRESPWEERFNPTFWDRIEGRAAIGHAPWDEFEPTGSERAYWYRFDDTPRLADGTIDPLALVTMADTMPGSVFERVGSRDLLWLSPSADLTVHLLGEAESEWILAHNFARHAGEGYASLEMRLWDPERGLVAYATQMMFFSFPDGPPTDDELQVPPIA